MELKKAVELQVQYYGKDGVVRVDENGFLSLNDMNAYFPNKKLQDWLDNRSTKELIEALCQSLNPSKERDLKSPDESTKCLSTRRGRHTGGTYAHEILALDFAAWLSVEFRIHIYTSYINGTQRKQDWNIKRILAANNYKIMCEAIKADHEDPQHYHYSNEALMINEVIIGVRDKTARDNASEKVLDAVAWAEGANGIMISLGMDYQTRKKKLAEMYSEKYLPEHRDLIGGVA